MERQIHVIVLILSGIIPDGAGEEISAELEEGADLGEYSRGRATLRSQQKYVFLFKFNVG